MPNSNASLINSGEDNMILLFQGSSEQFDIKYYRLYIYMWGPVSLLQDISEGRGIFFYFGFKIH